MPVTPARSGARRRRAQLRPWTYSSSSSRSTTRRPDRRATRRLQLRSETTTRATRAQVAEERSPTSRPRACGAAGRDRGQQAVPFGRPSAERQDCRRAINGYTCDFARRAGSCQHRDAPSRPPRPRVSRAPRPPAAVRAADRWRPGHRPAAVGMAVARHERRTFLVVGADGSVVSVDARRRRCGAVRELEHARVRRDSPPFSGPPDGRGRALRPRRRRPPQRLRADDRGADAAAVDGADRGGRRSRTARAGAARRRAACGTVALMALQQQMRIDASREAATTSTRWLSGRQTQRGPAGGRAVRRRMPRSGSGSDRPPPARRGDRRRVAAPRPTCGGRSQMPDRGRRPWRTAETASRRPALVIERVRGAPMRARDQLGPGDDSTIASRSGDVQRVPPEALAPDVGGFELRGLAGDARRRASLMLGGASGGGSQP